ncbi:MAG: aminomethyl transferase family protein [Acidobacteria bacterium]|nr:MAG: aminomethyl transferase family protein [Acidobacteriota bacterium]
MNADLMRSPLADYHASQGATLAEYHGVIVPSRFTSPFQEHLAVRAAAGIFDFSFRAKFALTGRDAAKFLHRIVSNDIKSVSVGGGTYAALLNPQGKILADLRVYAAQDRLLVDTDADLRFKATETLRRYIIGDQVQVEPLDTCALAFEGPNAPGLLEKTLHEDLPAMKEFDHFATNFAGFPVRVVRMSNTGEEGYELWAAPKAMMGLWGAACGQAPSYGMLPCGTEALESLRIEAGIPRYGSELGEDTLPLEANLMNALSFNKGCYIGQEIVERTRSRGHVNWKLAGVIVESAQPPAPGEKLTIDGNEIGEVTSACVSPTLQKTIALAYLRREHLEPGTQLRTASGRAAEVTTLPFYHAAASVPGKITTNPS